MNFENNNSVKGAISSKKELENVKKLIKKEIKYPKEDIRLKIGDNIRILFGDSKHKEFSKEENKLLFPSAFPSFKSKHSAQYKFYFSEIYLIEVNKVTLYDHTEAYEEAKILVKKDSKKMLDEFFPEVQQTLLSKSVKKKISKMNPKIRIMFVSSLKELFANLLK